MLRGREIVMSYPFLFGKCWYQDSCGWKKGAKVLDSLVCDQPMHVDWVPLLSVAGEKTKHVHNVMMVQLWDCAKISPTFSRLAGETFIHKSFFLGHQERRMHEWKLNSFAITPPHWLFLQGWWLFNLTHYIPSSSHFRVNTTPSSCPLYSHIPYASHNNTAKIIKCFTRYKHHW